ncbi:peptide MFS transporter [Rurimicrobium arvi]|uniref:Peptide MFS transporter n=1 Tax=Rurimicrobium arvi TaxID=2049916 RepID=A0ABP8MUZ8_9BACT
MAADLSTPIPQKGHPKALYLLFFTEMWERFSYYGMRGILILYLTKKYFEGGLAIDPAMASQIYGYFTGFVYFTPLIGGWLADRYLGQRLAITIGGLTMMVGQFTLFAINTHTGMYLGLLLLIIGNGFFKPNISTLVGRLYEAKDPRRDAAFSIFYMGINLGAFLAPLVIGQFTDNIFSVKDEAGNIVSYGYKWGFLASGIGMLLGQIIFNALAAKYLGTIGKAPVKTVAGGNNDAHHALAAQPVTKENKQQMTVIFILTAFVIFFWAGFEQAGSSLSLYTDKFINRQVGNFTIPTPWFQSVNPLFIIVLAPLFSIFWVSKLGQRLSTPVKMGLGMVLLGIGYFFMLGAIAQRGGDIQDETVKASLIWLVLTYLLHTIGELCLSPVGLSVVTKLAHPKYASLMMGVWMLATFIANIVGGYLAAFVEELGAKTIFTSISTAVIVLGLIMVALSKPISKMMHGVK